MKVTMIGHASVAIEAAGLRILMDPVLWDPHHEGLFAVSPTRVVDHGALPLFHVVVLSHRHLDHFDVRSLAAIPRSTEVLFPRDPLIARALARLGFHQAIPLDDWTEVVYGATRILTTPSLCPVPEMGVVVSCPDGNVWNQVDTVVANRTIDRVVAYTSGIDLLLAPWQPMLETAYLWGRSLAFPHDDYAAILERIRRVRPGALCPGANGFRYLGASAWLNRAVFPVTRERFCEDVARACPGLTGHIWPLDPGQSLSVERGQVRRCEDASYVRTFASDRDASRFRPNQVERDMSDLNEAGHDVIMMRREIAQWLAERFPTFLRERAGDLFAPHQTWGVVYQLTVVFPDGEARYVVDFRESPLRVDQGDNPVANFHVSIAASALHELIQDGSAWSRCVLGGQYRVARSVVGVGPEACSRPREDELPEPLWLHFPYEEGLARLIERQVERYAT